MTTPSLARYVCRDHLARVDWRGRGCDACTVQHSMSRSERRRLRRARRMQELEVLV